MCNALTIPSVARLRRAVRRWRARGSGSAAVPAGHVAVCAEGARFEVRLAHLGHPAFLELLRQAEEEYGFPAGAAGPVALPCDEDRLRDVLRRVSSSSSGPSGSLCSRRRGGDSRPLLQGLAREKLVVSRVLTPKRSKQQRRNTKYVSACCQAQLRSHRRRHQTGGTVLPAAASNW